MADEKQEPAEKVGKYVVIAEAEQGPAKYEDISTGSEVVCGSPREKTRKGKSTKRSKERNKLTTVEDGRKEENTQKL